MWVLPRELGSSCAFFYVLFGGAMAEFLWCVHFRDLARGMAAGSGGRRAVVEIKEIEVANVRDERKPPSFLQLNDAEEVKIRLRQGRSVPGAFIGCSAGLGCRWPCVSRQRRQGLEDARRPALRPQDRHWK